MTFPQTPLGLTVELLINGTWTDVTSLVYGREDLVVARGRSDEAGQVDRSTAKFQSNNRSGNLSPRNPTGTWYGLIGRNTRMRARLSPSSPGYLLMPVELDGAETPDSANLSITGDIDIRIDVAAADWGAVQSGLCNKFVAGGNQRSWSLAKKPDGIFSFSWSADGSTTITKVSTAAITPPAAGGRLALRVTLDVDNGAAGNDVKFYTSDTIAGTWTQLGTTVTTAGTTSIFDSTAPVQFGRANAGIGLVGKIYAFKLFQGIAGTLRADVNVDDEEAGAPSFVDGQGLTWTLVGDASVVDPAVRFHGEISEWPQRWDISGADVYVPLEASGILRRLGQGASPLKSTLYRGYTSASFTPRAYWPCEDGTDATQIASALGGKPMSAIVQAAGGTTPASFSSFTGFKCSEPIPTLGNTEWTGTVPAYAGTGKVQVFFLMHIPTGAAAVGADIVNVYTNGTVWFWRLSYAASDGGLKFEAFDSDGSVLFTNTTGFFVNDKLLRVDIELQQNGANIDWDVATLEVGAASGLVTSGTLNSRTISRCNQVRFNIGGDLGSDIAIGHISVHDQVRSLFDLYPELQAYSGETAGRRIVRLCGEENIGFRAVGNPDLSTPLGSQLPKTLVDLLREAAESDGGILAESDGGILYEPRDMFGLAYRTREDLYRQAAGLALDYAAAHLSGIEPTDDDQQTRNDITCKRVEGSSFRLVQDTGPLSVAAPPAGVGRYDEEVALSLQTDDQLPDQVGWRLHLGTVDEARYPTLSVDLARAPFVASSALSLAAQDLDVGDRLTVANPPAWLPPDLISQLAQGFVETMSNFTHRVDVNCSPETPWAQPAVYNDSLSRYSSDGSTLNGSLTTTATSVSVAFTGPIWSHADGDFQIKVAGEVMTVTAVAGAASPQTFTVTRSVNGVVKAHSSGETVTLEPIRVYVP